MQKVLSPLYWMGFSKFPWPAGIQRRQSNLSFGCCAPADHHGYFHVPSLVENPRQAELLNLKAAAFDALQKARRVLLVALMPEARIPLADRAVATLAKPDWGSPAPCFRDSPLHLL